MTEASRRKIYITIGIFAIVVVAAISTWMLCSKNESVKKATSVNGPSPSSLNGSKRRKINSKRVTDGEDSASNDSEIDNPSDGKPIGDQKPDAPKYRLLIHNEAMKQIQNYRNLLIGDKGKSAGKYLKDKAKAIYGTDNFSKLTDDQFLNALLATKVPQIAVASQSFAPKTNWSLDEVRLLGNVNLAMPVKVFDNGNWKKPKVYDKPFDAYLLFTPGAILTTASDVDRSEVVQNSVLNTEAYYALYERRLLPLFQFANDQAKSDGKKAIITFPGLGCGIFAGEFSNVLPSEFSSVLKKLLQKHHSNWPNISLVYYGMFSTAQSSGSNSFGSITYRAVCSSDNHFKELLEMPSNFAVENEESYSNHLLFAVVAWNHLSLPGNGFFTHSRNTDDAVKAAATSSMTSLLGIEGKYDPNSFKYLPIDKSRTWKQLAQTFQLNATTDTLYVVPPEI